MNSILDIAQKIGTPISLCAFVAALVFLYLRLRTQASIKQLSEAPKENLNAVLASVSGLFNINVDNLTREQKYQYVQQVLSNKQRTQTKYLVFSGFIAILLFALVIYLNRPNKESIISPSKGIRISGLVIDQHGKALESVVTAIGDRSRITNSAGYFDIDISDTLPGGSFNIVFKKNSSECIIDTVVTSTIIAGGTYQLNCRIKQTFPSPPGPPIEDTIEPPPTVPTYEASGVVKSDRIGISGVEVRTEDSRSKTTTGENGTFYLEIQTENPQSVRLVFEKDGESTVETYRLPQSNIEKILK